MRDNWLRRNVKRVALLRYRIDLGVTRAVTRWRGDAPDFELRGACNGCGACCTTPMVQVHTILFFARSTRWLILSWHRWVNGFAYVGENRRTRSFIFQCTHYDPATGACDSYDSRPGMCRDYPRNLLDHPNPEFLPPCSYYALSRDAEAIRESVAALALPKEEERQLLRRLHARVEEGKGEREGGKV